MHGAMLLFPTPQFSHPSVILRGRLLGTVLPVSPASRASVVGPLQYLGRIYVAQAKQNTVRVRTSRQDNHSETLSLRNVPRVLMS